jgi:hypothetical protein
MLSACRATDCDTTHDCLLSAHHLNRHVHWQIGNSHGTASRFTRSPGPPDGAC